MCPSVLYFVPPPAYLHNLPELLLQCKASSRDFIQLYQTSVLVVFLWLQPDFKGSAASTREVLGRVACLANKCAESSTLCEVILHAVLYICIVIEGFGLCNVQAVT